MKKEKNSDARCPWPGDDPLMIAYHDTEWGVPVHDDQKLFEFLVLDAFQAGLSWKTILHKREGFRAAFDGFDPKKIAAYTEKDQERLRQRCVDCPQQTQDSRHYTKRTGVPAPPTRTRLI